MNDRWVVEFTNDWKQLVGKWNWYTFTIVELYFENDKFTHGYEFVFTLLGLGIRIRYNTDKALKQFDKWEQEVNLDKLIEEIHADN